MCSKDMSALLSCSKKMCGNIMVFKGYKSMYYGVQRIQVHMYYGIQNTCAYMVHIAVIQL